jgi:catechol-2,3-dioxygenase
MTENRPTRGRVGLSEVVLRTPAYEQLCAFYTQVLQMPPTLDMTPESGRGTTDPDVPTRIAFFNLPGEYPYLQRVAIFETLDVGGRDRRSVGLHHLQLRLRDLETLFDAYVELKGLGHVPVESSNHGIATSLYYQDPDGNRVELSGLNFPDEAGMRGYMQTERFKTNPDGEEIDPEDIVRRRQSGTPLDEMLRLA